MLTFGADVELVINHNNAPLSSIGLIGGSKERPFLVEHGNLQEDNVLAEFAIDPVSSLKDWLRNLSSVQKSLALKLGGYELKVMPSVLFPDEQLITPEAKVFGCDPDFNAWELMENEGPDPEAVGNLRTCGGHIHIGFPCDPDDFLTQAEMAQWCDLYLGLPSVVLDDDRRRREVYGKAGAFRPKPYGMEYRTLSNFWLRSNQLKAWTFRQSKTAAHRFMKEGPLPAEIGEDVQRAINKGDAKLGIQLMNKFGVNEEVNHA